MLLQRQLDDGDDGRSEAGCRLMDSFAIFIQLCLAMIAFSTLIIKRHRENPQRPVRIWAFDVGKQLIGNALIHTLNVVASYLFGTNLEGGGRANPCVWYFLNILVDTTIGVGIIWGFLAAANYIIQRLQISGYQSGFYGDPPLKQQLIRWTKQTAVYSGSLIFMKINVIILFHLCPWLESFGHWVLGWTMGNYKLQVFFVMLVFPLVMNIFQFWIVDTIVKYKPKENQIRLDNDSDAIFNEDMLILEDDSGDEFDADRASWQLFHVGGSDEEDATRIHFDVHDATARELDPWKADDDRDTTLPRA